MHTNSWPADRMRATSPKSVANQQEDLNIKPGLFGRLSSLVYRLMQERLLFRHETPRHGAPLDRLFQFVSSVCDLVQEATTLGIRHIMWRNYHQYFCSNNKLFLLVLTAVLMVTEIYGPLAWRWPELSYHFFDPDSSHNSTSSGTREQDSVASRTLSQGSSPRAGADDRVDVEMRYTVMIYKSCRDFLNGRMMILSGNPKSSPRCIQRKES